MNPINRILGKSILKDDKRLFQEEQLFYDRAKELDEENREYRRYSKMPRRDGRGPAGKGPRTGRGLGPCR